MKRLDLVGKIFGKWTVLAHSRKNVITRYDNSVVRFGWECLCSCGAHGWVTTQNLNSGTSTQCRSCSYPAEGVGVFNDLLGRYKASANKRGKEWSLTEQEVQALFNKPCHYCGEPPSQIWERKEIGLRGSIVYSGIDRTNNDLGYTTDNCVPCCKRCNIAKRSFSSQDFISHAKRIADHAITEAF